MNLVDIKQLVAGPFSEVNAAIEYNLRSQVSLIGEVGHHIIHGGGKRLRPLLHLLAALSLDYKGQDHIQLATVIEFIHTATLLHDDVVDNSAQRRGRATANTIWGNAPSVLVGDFLYSRAFQMMVTINHMDVMAVLSHTTNIIAEGEVLQLLYRHQTALTEEQYFHVIDCKTAALFKAATELAAIIANANLSTRKAMAAYGYHTGIAFQLIDDILDYSADPKTLGKNLGDDLAEGKMTLPLILTFQLSGAATQAQIQKAIETPNNESTDFEHIKTLILQSGALEKCQERVQDHVRAAQQAIASLPENPYRQALFDLAQCAAQRTS